MNSFRITRWSQSPVFPIVIAVATYLLFTARVVLSSLHLNGHHFIYALDDPYIHLALAENLNHGHYGINASEFASPSSSILWPFLLAPFARLAGFAWVPFVLNFLAGIGVCILAGASLNLWPTNPEDADDSQKARDTTYRKALTAFALVFIGNLVGLTMVGMEHTLQVFLAGAGAWGILLCLRGRNVPWWCLALVALGPLVRYEAVDISLALAIALFAARRRMAAGLLLLASVLPLVGFSLFLHHLGLPWLPTSVLVKGDVSAANASIPHRVVGLVHDLAVRQFVEPERLLVSVLFLIFACMAWKERVPSRRGALAGVAAGVGMHVLVGRFGWFHRYEVYIVFFACLILLYLVQEYPKTVLGWYALALFGCCTLYVDALGQAAVHSGEIYRQQYQMHRFVTEFYAGNYAVNDLGLVSYRRHPGSYVLDLVGLASVEAARAPDKSPQWLDSEAQKHNTGLVMIYRTWFREIPQDWTRIGQMCLITTGSCVEFYATPQGSEEELKAEFAAFSKTLPDGTSASMP